MDEAYALLSFQAGVFASEADGLLGGTRFIDKLRALRWELTPALLDDMRQEARALGAPERILVDMPINKQIESLIQTGTERQAQLTRSQH